MTMYTEEHVLMLEKGELSCEDFEAAMCDYADKDLPDSVKERVDTHAETCAACAEFKRTYLLTVSLASQLKETAPVSRDIQERLRVALNERLCLKMSA